MYNTIPDNAMLQFGGSALDACQVIKLMSYSGIEYVLDNHQYLG